jgi:hypothetical protein
MVVARGGPASPVQILDTSAAAATMLQNTRARLGSRALQLYAGNIHETQCRLQRGPSNDERSP